MKRARRLTCAVAACGLSACAAQANAPRVGAGAPVAETRDEILLATGDAVWRGDLAAAHAVLTRLADRERGAADPALDFWSELLALLRCDPIGRAPRADGNVDGGRDPWSGLRRLVQIERVRLSRRSEGDLPAAGATRPAAGATERGQLVWPVERERWNDELPLPAIVDRCLAPDWPAHAAAKARTTSRAPTANEAALVEGVANGFSPEHPAKPILLVQAAVLDIARGRGAAAMSPLARLADLAQDVLTAAERRQAILASALAAIADPAAGPDQLLARGRAGLAADLDAVDRRALTLALGERLLRDGRSDDAVALLGPPPHGDDEVGRFIAFRQIEAHARAGRRAELLAEAREALQQRSREEVEDDDALSAILDVALHTLLASPISAETLEVLETLGPPRERQLRAEAFARLALEAGVHRSAMTTFLWLHDNEPDLNRRLQHLARASVAAARAGDRAEFARTFRLLAGQEEPEPEPGAAAPAKPSDKKAARTDKADATVGKRGERLRSQAPGMVASVEGDLAHERRRASRSANWQRALLVVARDALPALVEGDDQANLDILVATLKRHLGEGGRGPVDEELTTLYRAASAHLKSGARAYAQNVGAPRRPILLGDVLVGRHPDVSAPSLDLRAIVGEVGPLVFVPRRGNDPSLGSLARWPGGFGTTWTGSPW